MKKFALTMFLGATLGSALYAQEVSPVAFEVGGGFTAPVGNTARNLDYGWNILGGVGVNFTPYIGLLLQADYNRMDINGGTLNSVGFPGGDVSIFSATLNPIIHVNPKGHADVYIIGGGGFYQRRQEFTAPSVLAFTGFDPFFGFYTAAVPTTSVLSSYTVNKPGVNIGAGIAFGSKWRGKFFAEARYNRIFMGNEVHTDYIPVSFGYRF